MCNVCVADGFNCNNKPYRKNGLTIDWNTIKFLNNMESIEERRKED